MRIHSVRIAITIILLLAGSQHVCAQGTFENLNFESPIPPLIRDIVFKVPIANALPGWNGYIGGNQVNRILSNTRNLDAAGISLHGAGSDSFKPLSGSYSVFLQGSSIAAPTASAAIAQTGQIPQDALSLLFFGNAISSFQVTFSGQIIPLIQIGSDGNQIGGDISRFRGQVGELRFTALPLSGGLLDDIQFSTQPIPEPRVIALLFSGALTLSARWWRRRG